MTPKILRYLLSGLLKRKFANPLIYKVFSMYASSVVLMAGFGVLKKVGTGLYLVFIFWLDREGQNHLKKKYKNYNLIRAVEEK